MARREGGVFILPMMGTRCNDNFIREHLGENPTYEIAVGNCIQFYNMREHYVG